MWYKAGANCDRRIMNETTAIIPAERLDRTILVIRGQKVMLDADLAELYGVSTKALNQAVKRNDDRFPADFMFQLTEEEKKQVVTICDHLRKLRYASGLPHAFTEHGAVMLASVLNSTTAVQASIAVVRAFLRLRQLLSTQTDLARKVAVLERKYDAQFKVVFDAIKKLMAPDAAPGKKIGF
jgi:hypothetical protein